MSIFIKKDRQDKDAVLCLRLVRRGKEVHHRPHAGHKEAAVEKRIQLKDNAWDDNDFLFVSQNGTPSSHGNTGRIDKRVREAIESYILKYHTDQ